MRKEDFVVGKIYIAVTGNKWSYVGPNPVKIDKGFFLNLDNIKEEIHSYSYTAWPWKEYRKLRKGTRWMNVYSYPDGCIYTNTFETKKEAKTDGRLINTIKLACIEVPWIEEQGL